ncbi:unnamed protein product [Danaus chrysippus]|uniref:(African queen) hypothetical protein n=1 Tax=Danaus chrysippus TaxID=151541 RepID=A0A8J2VTB0_9NEOP|nr:unnamed protein product [Danaus chrysippus]
MVTYWKLLYKLTAHCADRVDYHGQRGGSGSGARRYRGAAFPLLRVARRSHQQNGTGTRRARRDASVMDNETVLKLIEIVKGYVFLYDLSHHQYKNTNLKTKVWESIGRELNYSGEAVRSKWKTIRDGYTKYKKQLKTSPASSKTNVTYTWAPQLSFLENHNAARTSYSKISLDTSQSTPDSDHSQDASSPLSTTFPLQSPIKQVSPRSNKRQQEDYKRDEDDIQIFKPKKRKELDVIDNLFLSYADTFKKFPAREQVYVKLELAKLFSDIELKLLNEQANESIICEPTIGKVKEEPTEDTS